MARGGMGEIFLAAAGETGGFEKLCVVKKVLTDLEDDGVRRRFLDEAKVVVRLNHSNLVQVFDAGRVLEEHYLAMELVEGKDLRGVWNRCAQLHRRIPVDFAMFVVRELCRGLDYVHDAMGLNLVHRDISPPNIMIGYHGQIKITDFGLATHAIKRELTNPGVVFGRFSYLSPEQARGLPADRRTDIYASGIVLWEMLTGRQLFPAERATAGPTALAELRNPDIRAPSEIVPGVPEGLDEVVLMALATEREDRYQTSGEFKVALSEVLNRYNPACDVDTVAAVMREIFAREYKLESEDYARYTREDFSPIRAQANSDDSESLSISDATVVTKKTRGRSGRESSAAAKVASPVEGDTSSILLDDFDIIELERSRARGWADAPSSEVLMRAAQSRVGDVVSQRYRIDRLLGIGGMGAVYAVTHLALGKTYALKVLHDVFSRDPDLIDRFMREARAATQTGHPNIIDVIDIGTVDESADVYFVMELLAGTDIEAVIRESGPLAIRRSVHIARQICRALAAAHEAGIIHRDLKSENVILTVKGGDPDFVKVLDFGICKQVDSGASSSTTPGMVMGSPDYMAPEQAAGAPANTRSDIYALGTILFEMLAGRLPFLGRNAIDVLMKKGASPAPEVSELRPEVPPALAEVISRCLSRDLADRPGSMKTLEYELTRALEGRASAVAAVMGLNLDAEAQASASGSEPRPLFEELPDFEDLEAGEEGAAPRPRQRSRPRSGALSGGASQAAGVITVHDQAEAAKSQVAAELEPRSWFKPGLALGLLGFSVAALLVFEFGLFGLGGEDSSANIRGVSEGSSDQTGGQTPGRLGDSEGEPSAENLEGAPGAVGETEDSSGEVVESGEGESGELDTSVEGIIARAEQAFESEHWREPAAGSLAIELTNLGIADPGNEAIGRLRGEAEKVLEPAARKAAKESDWELAVAGYRDLLAVWPDHEKARDAFVEALRKLARGQLKRDDFEGLLVTADELLLREPRMFVALKYRADALAGLERWEEAAPAYRQAMRVRSTSKDAKKGYWRARHKLKQLQSG